MVDRMPEGYFFTRAQWSALPLKLRQRWWRETAYGMGEPSAELLEAVGLRSRDTVEVRPDG